MSENKGKREEEEARPWQSYHTVFTNAKAGMDGVDKEKVQRIVYEMSKGSKYFENEKRKEEFIKQKIDNMRERCAKLTATDISHHQMVADKRIVELEAARDLSKTWLHVDMDAFYAAVETLVNPSLRGKPMAVGSMSMLSTANYEARKFGVRAAMPGFIARKLCPNLIFVPVDFKKYTCYSELTRKVFQKYDPNFIASSLDEAYLDITEVCKERDVSGEEVALELRTAIYEETGLTCSAGVAPNRLLAKVCSDINKPNGQFVLPNDRMAVMTFISSLPIRKIGGIGKVTEHILRDVLGISTCEEMLQKSAYLCALFSHSSTDFFLSVSLGLGGTETPEIRLRKSMSTERTFAATEDEALLYKKLADIAETLSSDMQKEALSGRTLTLKLKTMSFEVRSRAVSLQKYISSSEDILRYASKLLKAELPLSVRLIGLRISHFSTDRPGLADPAQKTLMDYVISKEASATVLYGESSRGSDSSHNHFRTDEESKLPLDAHEACVLCGDHTSDSGDPSNSIQYTDFVHESHIWNDVAGELEKPRISQSNECLPKMASPESLGFIVPSNEADRVQTADTELSSGQSRPELAAEKRANLFDKKQSMSLNENEQSIWVDEYKCSLCGVELPPSFIEERQEHSDYHLAEMLQKEESEHNSRNIMCRQRSSQKAQIIQEKKRKKHKVSPKIGKHIPIDLFFAKSNQNF